MQSNSPDVQRRGESSNTAKRVRILIVAPSFDILGGQAVQASRLMERLRQEPGLAVSFLPINPRLPGILRKLQSVQYLRTVVTSLAYVATLLVQIPKYDIIHVFSASYFSFLLAPTPAILISKLFGKKVLLNYHSGEAEDHLQRWRRSAIPIIHLVDELAVPSEYLVRIFAKFRLKARAIHNLIEVEKFAFRERVPLRPLFLSNRNLEIHYGVDCVLRAFAIIQERFPNAKLTIVGDGSQRTRLEQLARELGLKNTYFMGRIENEAIVRQYDSADIFLNGSQIDNQPLSILEAFSSGLAVVSTDAGAIRDMVTNGKTGFVVNSGDHKAIAARAIQLLEDPGLANGISRRAREQCRNYSWAELRESWLKCYQEIVSSSAEVDQVSTCGCA